MSPEGSVDVQPSQIIASRGENVTFNCSVQGGPGNTFQWLKNGVITVEESSVLTVTNVTVEKGAEYTCIVSNAAGSESKNASLFIAPKIIQPPQAINTTNGSTENFTCLATGYPEPEIRWYKSNSPDHNDIKATFNMAGSGSTLDFDPVTFGDEGYYHCVASTDVLGSMQNLSNVTESDVVSLTSKWMNRHAFTQSIYIASLPISVS